MFDFQVISGLRRRAFRGSSFYWGVVTINKLTLKTEDCDVKITWKVLIIATVVWLCFIGLYAWLLHITDDSTNIGKVVEFVGMWIPVYGIAVSAIIVTCSSKETAKARYEFDKIENTFKLIELWDRPSLKEALDMTRAMKAKVNKMSKDDLKAEINNNEDKYRSVITMCNFFEEIYYSLLHKRVHTDLLKDAFGFTYIDIFDRFKDWITETLDENTKNHLLDLRTKWDATPKSL